MKGFKLNENAKSDIFAIITNYKNKIKSCLRYINRLMNNINKLTNETVSVGLLKFNSYEISYKQWKFSKEQSIGFNNKTNDINN